jgi:hypothetical protein
VRFASGATTDDLLSAASRARETIAEALPSAAFGSSLSRA